MHCAVASLLDPARLPGWRGLFLEQSRAFDVWYKLSVTAYLHGRPAGLDPGGAFSLSNPSRKSLLAEPHYPWLNAFAGERGGLGV
jgi:hypothetical protein